MSDSNSIRNRHLEFRQSHAIVIGIDYYPLFNAQLHTAVNDAVQIAGLLASKQEFDNVLLMTNPTRVEINALLEWLQNRDRPEWITFPAPPAIRGKAARSRIGWPAVPADAADSRALQPRPWRIDPAQDSLLFYFAGHGIPGVIEEGPAGYLVPSDGKNKITQNSTLVEMDAVYKALRSLGCHHTLLILDCCFSGKFRFSNSSRFEAGTEVVPLYRQRFLRYKKGRAWQVLASAASDQTAADSANWVGIRDHSPFAATLIEALQGAADLPLDGKRKGDGVITAAELYLYVRQKVEIIIEAGQRKPQHPGLFPMEDHRGGEFIFLNSDFDLTKLEDRQVQNPYKGLLSFEPRDRQWFYGREVEIAEVFAQIKDYPMMIIAGPSAVGKSSLVKAGVFPKMEEDFGFKLLKLRPGPEPWTGEEIKLSRTLPDGTLQQQTSHFSGLRALCLSQVPKQDQEADPIPIDNTYESVVSLLDPAKSREKRLLLIDQYEEIFTDSTEEQRQIFEQALILLFDLAARSRSDDPEAGSLRILITIRSDFEWQLEASAFGKHLASTSGGAFYNLYRLAPMKLDQLKEALVGPADKEIFELEGDLAERILTDLNYSPAALSLLSFSMQKLFQLTIDKGETDELGDPKRILTQQLYADDKEGLGGVSGALRGSAEQLYESLLIPESEDQAPALIDASGQAFRKAVSAATTRLQRTLIKIMLRLIRPGDGLLTRRRVYHSATGEPNPWSELDYPNDRADAMVNEILEKLEATQLIVRGRDMGKQQDYIELAHDSLITHWPRCLQWIKDFGQENLVLQRQLWSAVLEFQSRKENESFLWDTHPKLEQLFRMIVDPEDKLQEEDHELLTAVLLIWNIDFTPENQGRLSALAEWWKEEYELAIPLPAKGELPDVNALVDTLLSTQAHWLNQQEVSFISRSWKKRKERITKVRNEQKKAVETEKALLLEKINDIDTFNQAGDFDRSIEMYLVIGRDFSQYPLMVKSAGAEIVLSMLKHARSVAKTGEFNQALQVLEQATGLDLQKEEIQQMQKLVFLLMLKAQATTGTIIKTIEWRETAADALAEGMDKFISLFKRQFPAIANTYGKFLNQGALTIPLIRSEVEEFATDIENIHQYFSSYHKNDQIFFALDLKVFFDTWDWLQSATDLEKLRQNFLNDVLTGKETPLVAQARDQKVVTDRFHRFGGGLHLYSLENEIFQSLSPNGAYLLTKDRYVLQYKLWELESGKMVHTFEKIAKEINLNKAGSPSFADFMRISPSGGEVLTLSKNNRFTLWDMRSEEPIYHIDNIPEGVTSAIMTSAGEGGDPFILAAAGKKAWLWHLGKPEPIQEFECDHNIISMAVDPHVRFIGMVEAHPSVGVGSDFHAYVWPYSSDTKLLLEGYPYENPAMGHRKRLYGIAASPREDYFLTVGLDHMAKLWDSKNGKVIRTFPPLGKAIASGSDEEVTSIVRHGAFSPDGRYIITAGQTCRIWSIKGQKPEYQFTLDGKSFNGCEFTRDGRFVITGSEGTPSTIDVWLNPL
jgi:hypothetical protein